MNDEQPTAPACACCGGDRDRPHYTTCRPCTDWIRDHLNEVEHLWQELPQHLERGSGAQGPRVSGGGNEAPIPLVEDVLNLMVGGGGAPARLARHDAAIRAARGRAPIDPRGSSDGQLAAAVGSLRRNLGWAAEHHDTYPLAVELRDLTREMRLAVGDRSDSIALGTECPAQLSDGTECGGTLRYHRMSRAITCPACGHRQDASVWFAAVPNRGRPAA